MIEKKQDAQYSLTDTRQLIRELSDLGDVQAPPSIVPAVMVQVGLADAFFSHETPLGMVFVAYNDQGISAVMLASDRARFESAFRARFGRAAYLAAEPPVALVGAVRRYLAGDKGAGLRFDLRGQTDFERAVLEKALEIPRGEVRPYAWIAREIGRPGAVRAVGSALGQNPIPLLIPCHRVVRSDGHIGNYALGSDTKRAVLAAEGVDPEGLERLADSGVRYYGSDTTHIFCYPTCRHARQITERHRVAFGSFGEAVEAGYRSCKVCRPVNQSTER